MNGQIHNPLLWFIAAVIVIAIAGPFPGAATMLLLIIIVLVLLKNWPAYQAFLPGQQQAGG